MAWNLFGFTIGSPTKKEEEENNRPSFVPPSNEDGSLVVAEGNFSGQVYDFGGASTTEADLINKYREMAEYPDVDYAIDDIVNESISIDEDGTVVRLNMENFDESSVFSDEQIQDRIQLAFKRVLELLDFNNKAYQIFRRWYIDGRLYYHIIVDEKQPKMGIKEVRNIDPRKIRKIKEVKRSSAPAPGAALFQVKNEYYVYSSSGFGQTQSSPGAMSGIDSTVYGLKIAKDSVVYCHSGLLNAAGNMVISHLHKAMKIVNQLRAMQDSMVIYRLVRAPERRVFYIDVGNLPKQKAEQYLRDMMVRHKNKLVYDASNGVIRDDRRFMTMHEDYWLARREGGKGTEITTLPGAQNLGNIEDIENLQQGLYRALNIPPSRLNPETSGFTFAKAAEISRDENKFARFVDRLRRQFTTLLFDLVVKELLLTGVIAEEDVQEFYRGAFFEFAEDNHYAEVKDNEILSRRVEVAKDMQDFVGKYFSHDFVRRHVFRQDDDEIEKMDDQIEEEKDDPRYEEKPDGSNGIDVMDPTFGGGFGQPGMPMGMPGQPGMPGMGMPGQMMPGQQGMPPQNMPQNINSSKDPGEEK